MAKVDWNRIGAELKATSAPKRKNDHEVSEPSEVDLLKHIEDALRMDAVSADRGDTRDR